MQTPDRETVVHALKCCNSPNRHEDCPYDGASHYNSCTHRLLNDAITLLSQCCDNCKYYCTGVNEVDTWEYCKITGRTVPPDFYCGYWEGDECTTRTP